MVSKEIQYGLIELAVNNPFNPVEASYEIAECIKTKTNTFSLKMECAVEGLQHMDKEMMNRQWYVIVDKYNRDPSITNLKTDKSTWTITYDRVELSEIVSVKTEDEDFLLNGPR